jgi:hypothetical protein
MNGKKPDFETNNETENPRDENMILANQDETSQDTKMLDENLGQHPLVADPMEEEPGEFVRGEIDVVEQMKRTTRAMDHVIHGHGEGGTNT